VIQNPKSEIQNHLSGSGRHDQVNKGKRWMSWR
jgi:hypothetical protein